MAGPSDVRRTVVAAAALAVGEAVVPTALISGETTTHLYVTPVAAQGTAACGVVAEEQDTIGGLSSIVISGDCNCLAGEAIAAGDAITPGADARWETALAGDIVHGYARTAAAADGDLFEATIGTPDSGRVV